MRFCLLLLAVKVACCSEEALYNLNQALTLLRFQDVTLITDTPVTFTIQTSCRVRTSPGNQIKASALVRVFCGGIWHTAPFPMPESGDEEIQTEYSRPLVPGTSLKGLWISRLTKTNGPDCFYKIHYTNQALTIHITAVPTAFLVMNPCDLTELTSIETKLPPYAEYFKSEIFPRIQDAYNPQSAYDALLERLETTPFDAPLKVPTHIHTIWFTDPSNPKLPKEECFDLLRRTIQTCPAQFGWRYTLWVHKITDNAALADSPTHDIELDRIIDVKETNTLFQNNDPLIQAVLPFYETALAAKNYGMASDIARLVVLYLEGGVYRDTDFAFLQSPKRLHQVCSFYGGLEDTKCMAANNAMIASSSRHPILARYLSLICTPPTLPTSLQNPVMQTLFHTGPFAMTIAFYSSCHSRTQSESRAGSGGDLEESDNQLPVADSYLFPPHIFYLPPRDGSGERKFWPLTTLGQHNHFSEWVMK